jgi:hypothetical protein
MNTLDKRAKLAIHTTANRARRLNLMSLMLAACMFLPRGLVAATAGKALRTRPLLSL